MAKSGQIINGMMNQNGTINYDPQFPSDGSQSVDQNQNPDITYDPNANSSASISAQTAYNSDPAPTTQTYTQTSVDQSPPPSAPPTQTAPTSQPVVDSGSDALYQSMLARMNAVQSGQADPGNPDLYGVNQTTTSTLAPGWVDYGNGLAKNPATGQILPMNDPLYQQLLTSSGSGSGTVTAPGISANDTLTGGLTSPAIPTNLTAPTTGNSVDVSGIGTISNGALTSSTTNGPSTDITPAGQEAMNADLPTASNVQNPGTPDVADATYATSPAMQALLQQMTGITGQSLDIDPNDPVIKSQVDAYQAQQERATRNAINDAAEQNGPYNSGQQANNARMLQEQEGQNVGQFQGQVMQNELTARRNEIQSILQTQGSLLSQDQQNALQTELANLNSHLSQTGMSVQNTQFYAGLNTQDKQFVDQLTQNEQFKNMDDVLSRYTLYQQQSQFAASLAQQGDFQNLSAALQQAGMNQQNQQFLMSLAQNGNIAQMQQEFQRMQLAQDQNQFVASLAQQGNIAQMQNVFQNAQLAQQEGQFEASLGFQNNQSNNYFDYLNSQGS